MLLCYFSYLSLFSRLPKKGYVPIVYMWDLVSVLFESVSNTHTHTHTHTHTIRHICICTIWAPVTHCVHYTLGTSGSHILPYCTLYPCYCILRGRIKGAASTIFNIQNSFWMNCTISRGTVLYHTNCTMSRRTVLYHTNCTISAD